MTPRIETLKKKQLVGQSMKMSLVNNKTGALWQNFMRKRKEITNTLTNEKISLQVYDSAYFNNFNPNKEFVKWATVEVSNFNDVPNGMETFTLVSGLYAVFDYKGSSKDNSIFNYIFATWLPNSDYYLDNRPHFEVLGETYKNNDLNSEEEIWIPIQPKQELRLSTINNK